MDKRLLQNDEKSGKRLSVGTKDTPAPLDIETSHEQNDGKQISEVAVILFNEKFFNFKFFYEKYVSDNTPQTKETLLKEPRKLER